MDKPESMIKIVSMATELTTATMFVVMKFVDNGK